MTRFKHPKKSLGLPDWETTANVIEAATDIALVIDGAGVIIDAAIQQADLATKVDGAAPWLGRPWIETVTVESRPKVTALLAEAAANRQSGWRQINHHAAGGTETPVLYSTVQLGDSERFVALGRDLRPAAELQQRLVEAQMSVQRDYAQLRQVEARYRLLFHFSLEPTLIVDTSTRKVLEANPSAVRLLGDNPAKVVSRPFLDIFASDNAQRVTVLLGEVRSSGREAEVHARLAHGDRDVRVTVMPFRQETSSMILVRILPAETAAPPKPRPDSGLLTLADHMSDGMVVTDRDGTVLDANKAFAEMAQLTGADQARGENLERWLGRPGIDAKVLVANLAQNESVRMFSTVMRGDHGVIADVEVSAVAFKQAMTTRFGFTIRDVSRRLPRDKKSARELPRSAEQLTELIGRVPLKDLVHETIAVIEQLCIETALNLTGNNRAAAADMLGLSRQSLYVKLRQFGISEQPDDRDS